MRKLHQTAGCFGPSLPPSFTIIRCTCWLVVFGSVNTSTVSLNCMFLKLEHIIPLDPCVKCQSSPALRLKLPGAARGSNRNQNFRDCNVLYIHRVRISTVASRSGGADSFSAELLVRPQMWVSCWSQLQLVLWNS